METELDLDIDYVLELIYEDEPIPLDLYGRLLDQGIDVDAMIQAESP